MVPRGAGAGVGASAGGPAGAGGPGRALRDGLAVVAVSLRLLPDLPPREGLPTNGLNLTQYLSQHQCDGSRAHEHHNSAQHVCEDAYPMQLAKTIAEVLFPSHAFKSVPHMTGAYGMMQDPRGLGAVQKEADGLRASNTWDDK